MELEISISILFYQICNIEILSCNMYISQQQFLYISQQQYLYISQQQYLYISQQQYLYISLLTMTGHCILYVLCDSGLYFHFHIWSLISYCASTTWIIDWDTMSKQDIHHQRKLKKNKKKRLHNNSLKEKQHFFFKSQLYMLYIWYDILICCISYKK